MNRTARLGTLGWLSAGLLGVALVGTPSAQQGSPAPARADGAPYRSLVSTYCVSCHNGKMKAGNLELDAINTSGVTEHWEAWEKVARKLRARQMPPQGSRRPDEAGYTAALQSLESSLDALATTNANPGRTDTFRRLNR